MDEPRVGFKMYVMCTVSMDEPRVGLNMYLSQNRISMYFYSIFHVWQNWKRVFILISILKLGQRNVQGWLFIKRCQCSEQLWETVSAMTPWWPSTVNWSLFCLRSKRELNIVIAHVTEWLNIWQITCISRRLSKFHFYMYRFTLHQCVLLFIVFFHFCSTKHSDIYIT